MGEKSQKPRPIGISQSKLAKYIFGFGFGELRLTLEQSQAQKVVTQAQIRWAKWRRLEEGGSLKVLLGNFR